jgi:hypothetical protein
MPPGLILIAQLLSSSVPATLDCEGPVRRMSCRVVFPGTKKISKLLLTASARSCYKERVQRDAMPVNTAKRSKGQRVP